MTTQEEMFSGFNFSSAYEFTASKSSIRNKEFSFFFSVIMDFLKMLTDVEFLIPILRLFHSFIQYGKKCAVEGFCFGWNWSYNKG